MLPRPDRYEENALVEYARGILYWLGSFAALRMTPSVPQPHDSCHSLPSQ
jgi:hypothetical protein